MYSFKNHLREEVETTKPNLTAAIDAVLDELDECSLRWLLMNQTDTIYRLTTLKNKVRKSHQL